MAATIVTGSRNPFDLTSTLKLNISEDIDVICPEKDIPLLRLLGFAQSDALETASASMGANSLSFPCTTPKHTWQNDELVQSEGTITSDYTALGGTLTVGATQIGAFRVDDIIRVKSSDAAITAATADLFYIVDAVGSTTIDVTALNTDKDIDSGDPWYNMGSAKAVGSSANIDGKMTVMATTDNFTQIFRDDVHVSGTEMSTEQFGITDPLAREIQKTAARVVIGLERAAHYGYRVSTMPSSSATKSRMGGLFYYTRVATGGLNKDAGGEPITADLLDTELERMWQAGGDPDCILVGPKGVNQIAKFNQPYTQTPRTDHQAGFVVDHYMSAVGVGVDVVLDRHLSGGDAVIVTKSMLGIGPLAGNGESRHFVAAEVPWTGTDGRHANITGEYTMEVRNRQAYHNWIYGLSTTV